MKRLLFTLAFGIALQGSMAEAQDRYGYQYEASPYNRTAQPGLLSTWNEPVSIGAETGAYERDQFVAHEAKDTGIGHSCSTCSECSQTYVGCRCRSNMWLSFDFLYLQPRGADIAFTFPALDGVFTPMGPMQQLDHDFDAGYRYSINSSLASCVGECSPFSNSWIGFTGTHYNTGTSRTAFSPDYDPALGTSTNLELVGRLMVLPPQLYDMAEASSQISFDTYDFDFFHPFWQGCGFEVYSLAGIRIATLDQQLNVCYHSQPTLPGSSASICSSIDMRGAGLRFGLGGRKCLGRFSFTARSSLSLMAADIDATFCEEANGTVNVNYSRDYDRLVPIYDIELGMGYDITQNFTLSAGYTYSIWFNVLAHETLIDSLRAGDYGGDHDDNISFDGFFTRLEYRW